MFVLGFIQGTIRRVLGLASMLFSFLFAANLRDPLGGYLAANWNEFPDEYAVMLGFGIVFVAATIAFTIVIQGFYHKQALFQKATFADEMIGGVLGIVQALFLVVLRHRDPRLVLPDPDDPEDRQRVRRGSASFCDVHEHVGDGRPVPDAADPGLHHGLRPADPARHPGVLRRGPSRLTPAARRRRDAAARRDAARAARPSSRPRRCSARGWSATTRDRPARRAGSSRSRRTSARTTGPRTPGSGGRPATRSCTGLRARPTCTLSTGCTTA